jgi:hypothetical protein
MTNSLLFISIECFVSANCSTPFYHSIARCERLLWESTLSAGMSPIRHACQLLDTCISLTTQIGTSVPTNVFNTLQNTSLNRVCQIASFTPKPDNWCPFACVIRPYHHANFTSPHLLIPESQNPNPIFGVSVFPILSFLPPLPPNSFFLPFQSLRLPVFPCSCHIHIISLMLILLLLPPGIPPAPLPFPLECECELPGAGLTDPLGCMGVGAR